MALSDDELARIERETEEAPAFITDGRAESFYIEATDFRALAAFRRRLDAQRAADAELREIRKEVGFLPHSGNPALVRLAAQIDTLFAAIGSRDAMITDLLETSAQFAAGFKACRQMAEKIALDGYLSTPPARAIAALTVEQHVAQRRKESQQ